MTLEVSPFSLSPSHSSCANWHTAKQTLEYGSYLPDTYADAFFSTAKTHHVRLIPVFLPNGKCVGPVELPIRLENAVIEVMFTLKHYYYGPIAGNFKQTKVGNTFTATIEQVTILQLNTIVPSPRRQPTMKTIQLTPLSKKGKSPARAKRFSSQSPTESSPSPPKRKKNEGLPFYFRTWFLYINCRRLKSCFFFL